MTTDKATLTSKPNLYNNADDYADVDFFICHAGVDWKFTFSLDKDDNRIFENRIQKSNSPNDSFELTNDVPPQAVQDVYFQAKVDAVNLLNSIAIPA